MNREFRFSATHYTRLDNNDQHMFAAKHALSIYRANAIYSFIPKCACSTMRFSLARANGCISDSSDVSWIHQNNETFVADLGRTISCDYAFVIIRCPYRRIASVFLDAVAKGKPRFEPLLSRSNFEKKLDSITSLSGWTRKIRRRYFQEKILSLTFHNFLLGIKENHAIGLDHHWVPQTNFLLYKEYDDVFCVEDFENAKLTLKEKIGFEVLDARSLIQHDVSRYKKISDQQLSNASARDISKMKSLGKIPSYDSLYDNKSKRLVEELYKDDLDFFIKHFGESKLLFS